MASFNVKFFEELMEKLKGTDDLVSSLKSLSVLAIPLNLAEQHNVIEKVKKLMPYAQMTGICSQIVTRLEGLKKVEQEKQTQLDGKNQKKQVTLKRKQEVNMEVGKKKPKLSESKKSEHRGEEGEVAKRAKETGIAAVTKKKSEQKAVVKKPSLLQKSLKDAFKFKRQFK